MFKGELLSGNVLTNSAAALVGSSPTRCEDPYSIERAVRIVLYRIKRECAHELRCRTCRLVSYQVRFLSKEPYLISKEPYSAIS